jgi:hypothetical protein
MPSASLVLHLPHYGPFGLKKTLRYPQQRHGKTRSIKANMRLRPIGIELGSFSMLLLVAVVVTETGIRVGPNTRLLAPLQSWMLAKHLASSCAAKAGERRKRNSSHGTIYITFSWPSLMTTSLMRAFIMQLHHDRQRGGPALTEDSWLT